MWAELEAQKSEWVGGDLVDWGDPFDRRMMPDQYPAKTKIVDIRVGVEQVVVEGQDFDCSGSRQHLGLTGKRDPLVDLLFSGFMGHEWGIKKPQKP